MSERECQADSILNHSQYSMFLTREKIERERKKERTGEKERPPFPSHTSCLVEIYVLIKIDVIAQARSRYHYEKRRFLIPLSLCEKKARLSTLRRWNRVLREFQFAQVWKTAFTEVSGNRVSALYRLTVSVNSRRNIYTVIRGDFNFPR